MRKAIFLVILMLLFFPISGCFTHTHTIGSAALSSGTKEYYVQWYALWGIVPLSDELDGGKLAGTTNCRITTQFSPLDCLINFFTGLGTIYRRTIIIEK